MRGLRKTKADGLREKYGKGSFINVRASVAPAGISDKPGVALHAIRIELHGPVSAIPSLKQSKLPGKNFMNQSTRIRLEVMDSLYLNTARKFPQYVTFGTRKVALLVLSCERSQHFDADNCLSTVCDWLEPATKQVGRTVKSRGWGIGLVENDSQIIGQSYRASALGLEIDHTIIIARLWDYVRKDTNNYLHEMFLGAI